MSQPVGASEVNQPTKNKHNGSQIKLIIDDVWMIF